MSNILKTPAVTPTFVSSISRWSLANEARAMQGGMTYGSTAWNAANQAVYTPIVLPWPYPMRRMFWVNGSAAGGNWNIGILTENGIVLWSSGSTAASGNSIPQYVGPSSPVLLAPGVYYVGLAHDVTTANHVTGITTLAAVRLRAAGVLEQASNLALASPWTPVVRSGALLPICGFTRLASGG